MGFVYISPSLKARLLRSVLRPLMEAALGGAQARLILQNPDDVRFFGGAGIVSADSIRFLPGSGVDFSRFVVPPERDPEQCELPTQIVLAARMLWDKGVGEFVEAARILQAEARKVRFILAGTPDPGNPAAIPEELLRNWAASGPVEWLGHVDDMPALYAAADIVVLPSYREGLPKSLIEAAACARPLITTDAPGCREVVSHEENGLLVPVCDAKALARAIARLCDDPALSRRLGLAARDKALAQFDERIIIERTILVYEELLAKEKNHTSASRP
jgi:glycosyltransferase involved in cell wall biosynthesis